MRDIKDVTCMPKGIILRYRVKLILLSELLIQLERDTVISSSIDRLGVSVFVSVSGDE